MIAYQGRIVTVGGTSASGPTFAAIIALLNDARIAAGLKPMGFLNPWVYGGGYKTLTDITTGSAIGCNVTGFPAEQGWDPVIGYGTPNFRQMVAYAVGGANRWGQNGKPGWAHGGW